MIAYTVGPRERNGKRLVIVEAAGRNYRATLDTDDDFQRSKWSEKVLCRIVSRLELAEPPDREELEAELSRQADVADERDESSTGLVPRLVCLADVQPESVEWLWPGRIALGKVTLIVGDPDQGKSLLTLDLAARVSLGSAWPDDRSRRAPRGSVILLSAEDDLADTIRPRLDAAGAEVTRVVALTSVTGRDGDGQYDRLLDLGRDLAAVEAAVEQTAGCRLIVVDPISAYLGESVDANKDEKLRRVLAPLAALAAKHRVAVVAVRHFNKGEGTAMQRSMGSMAFIAAARAAWAVVPDSEHDRRWLFLRLKNNLAPDMGGLAYVIEDRGNGPTIEWLPEAVAITADEALRQARHGGSRGEERRLVEWIERKGGSVTPREVQQGCRWLKGSGAAEAALEALADGGRGTWKATATGERGQPTRRFTLSTLSTVYGNSKNPEENSNTVDVDNVDGERNGHSDPPDRWWE